MTWSNLDDVHELYLATVTYCCYYDVHAGNVSAR